MTKVRWTTEPDEHDYPAAASYLSLLIDDPAEVARLVEQLKRTELTWYKAKDLLRAARLDLLLESDPHVNADLRKIRKGKSLSPILLVRGDLSRGFALQVADGYHRVCATYHVAENTDIPCQILPLPQHSHG